MNSAFCPEHWLRYRLSFFTYGIYTASVTFFSDAATTRIQSTLQRFLLFFKGVSLFLSCVFPHYAYFMSWLLQENVSLGYVKSRTKNLGSHQLDG